MPTPATTGGTRKSATRATSRSGESAAAVLRSLRGLGGQNPGHRVAYETGLLAAIDLDGETGDDLVPAAAFLLDGDDLRLAADLRVDRDRGREADLVPAVVDAEGEAGGADQLGAEAVDGGEGEVAVGDGGAVGALGLRPLGVDVDPLVVAGELGEGVDVGLGDRPPPGRADLLADQRLHPLDHVHLCGRHQSVQHSWSKEPSPSLRGPKTRTSRPSSPASKARVTSGETRIASRVSTSMISSSSLNRPSPRTMT